MPNADPNYEKTMAEAVKQTMAQHPNITEEGMKDALNALSMADEKPDFAVMLGQRLRESGSTPMLDALHALISYAWANPGVGGDIERIICKCGFVYDLE